MRIVGYISFFFSALLLCIYLTFPWDAAKDKVLLMASKKTGATITADKLEPNWITGIEAERVSITTRKSPEPIEIKELSARIHLMPLLGKRLGITASMPMAQGNVDAEVVQQPDAVDVDAKLDNLELALVPGIKEATGLPLGGQLNATIKLIAGTKDPTTSEGTIKLAVKGLEILKGGKLKGFPVPELAIGDLDWTIPVNAGKVKFNNLELTGDNILAKIDGEIILKKRTEQSVLNLTVAFKPTAAFIKKEPILKGALQMPQVSRAKARDGFYTYQASGTIKYPRFVPKRR